MVPALALVLAVSLAGCAGDEGDGADEAKLGTRQIVVSAETKALNAALRAERRGHTAYEAAERHLPPAARNFGRFSLTQQRVLEDAIRGLHGRPRRSPNRSGPGAEDVPARRDGLAAALAATNASASRYLAAVPTVISPSLRAVLGSMAASDAQQAVVLRHALGRRALAGFEAAAQDAARVTPVEGEPDVLQAAAKLESALRTTYEDILERGLVREADRELVVRLRARAVGHRETLNTALGARKTPEPGRPGREGIRGLTDVRTAPEALRLAETLEGLAVAGCQDAAMRLVDPELAAELVRIMVRGAQHAALLRRALGEDPVPSAIERGTTG